MVGWIVEAAEDKDEVDIAVEIAVSLFLKEKMTKRRTPALEEGAKQE